MNGEHAFNATKSMVSQFAAYFMTVAQKYGEQEALELLSSTFDQYGTQAGNMLKQQLGGAEATLQTISEVVIPMFEAQGFEIEEIERTANSITVKVPRCPLFEGCQEVGAPAEAFCTHQSGPLLNGLMKALNPTAQHKFIKRRTSADDYCIEQTIIE